MFEKLRARKKIVPIDYLAMVYWLKSKNKTITIENLGGGGPHSYGVVNDEIIIDGHNVIKKDQWERTCIAMATTIPRDRLDMASEYNAVRNFGNPSIPVLCWAMCEELLNSNKVWE